MQTKSKISNSATVVMMAIAVLTMVMWSCAGAQTAADGSMLNSGTTVMVPPSTDTVKTWTNFYAPVTVQARQPMSMSIGGRATMENGKYIHVSMRFIGMEVAVIYINTDSMYFVDKYHKYVFAEPLQTVMGPGYENLTLGEMQKVVLGQRTIPTADNISIVPSGYVNTPAGYVASKISLDVTTDRGSMSGALEWNANEAKWNDTSRKVKFKMPDNCRRITMDDLNTILKNSSF